MNFFYNLGIDFINSCLSFFKNLLLKYNNNLFFEFLFISSVPSELSCLDLNFIMGQNSFLRKNCIFSINFLLGLEEKSLWYLNKNFIRKKTDLVIYQGHHIESSFINDFNTSPDYFLPGLSFLEKKVSFINLNGIFQQTEKIYIPFKNMRNDFEILTALIVIFLAFKI